MTPRKMAIIALFYIVAMCGAFVLLGCAYRIPPAASRWIAVAGPRYIEDQRAKQERGELPADLADAYIDEALAVMNLAEQVNK